MKRRLVFIIPILAIIGFLLIKPPAIGSERKTVVVTPTSTSTPIPEPKLRDFDDEGKEPAHFGDDDNDHGRKHHGDNEDDRDHEDHGDHEDEGLEEDSKHKDD